MKPFASERPDIQARVEDAMSFRVSYDTFLTGKYFVLTRLPRRAGFMLTEVGHGLDAKYLETQTVLQPDGGFLLHNPYQEAAK